ncbi:hypothetical protein [Ochrovirga pacifica]|uniref:hypothetical protein n=1 Tax=Ochrovirga pacifica TaxID=1042376 RepID=UPI0002558776|nr:hypothetical protein [Ochrovirga pacifica]
MKKIALVILLIGVSTNFYGQILNDTVAQVVGYWNLNESHMFKVSQEKFTVKEKDTVYTFQSTCDLKITVKDSTATGYTVDWLYTNCLITSDNPVYQKINRLNNNLLVKFKTNELGGVLDIVNWEAVRDTVLQQISSLEEIEKENEIMKNALQKVKTIFASKEGIRNNLMKDAQQFYHFHGGSYELNKKYQGATKVSNSLGGSSFDAQLSVSLDEIDKEEGTIVLRSITEIDSEQLTKVTYDFIKSNMPKEAQSLFPTLIDFPKLTNTTYISSVIHEGTGWTTYTIEEKEVVSKDGLAVENKIIEFIE